MKTKIAMFIALSLATTALAAPQSKVIPGYGGGWHSDGLDWHIRYSKDTGSQSIYYTKDETFFIQCGDKGSKVEGHFKYEWRIKGKKGFYHFDYSGPHLSHRKMGVLPRMKVFGTSELHNMPESEGDFAVWGNDAFTRLTAIVTPEGTIHLNNPVFPVVCGASYLSTNN